MKNNKIHISISHFSFFILYLFLGLFLLECESQCRTVANLCRTKVLDWTRVNEACVASPLCTMTNEVLVRLARKLNESLLDNWLHLTRTLLHVHHSCDRNTTSDPFVSRLECVLDRRHVTCLASSDQHRSVETE